MKSPPTFLRGAFRSVLRFALQDSNAASAARDESRQCRAWYLFLLAPRMLLFRKGRGGLIPKNPLHERFRQFTSGEWVGLLHDSKVAAEEVLESRCRRRGTRIDSVERRAERAQALVALGEISSGRESLPDHLMDRQLAMEHELDRDWFLKTLRCARRDAAGGPSGVTAEHLRPILDSARDSELLWEFAQSFEKSWDASPRCANHWVGFWGSWLGMCFVASYHARLHNRSIPPLKGDSAIPVCSHHKSWS